MAWTESNTTAPDMRARLRRLFPAFAWELAFIDNLAETVEMYGRFRLNGQRCGVYLHCNHELFPETPDVDDRIKHCVAEAVARIVVNG